MVTGNFRYRFDAFVLDPFSGLIFRAGQRVALQSKGFEFLKYLIEHRGQIVPREAMAKHLWPDVHVQFDQGLNAAARKARIALEDSWRDPRYIETVGSDGYRFKAPVLIVSSSDYGDDCAQPVPSAREHVIARV